LEFTCEEYSKNPNVMYLLEHGLPNVTLLDPRTPPDGLDHFKTSNNALNKIGAETDHIEADIFAVCD